MEFITTYPGTDVRLVFDFSHYYSSLPIDIWSRAIGCNLSAFRKKSRKAAKKISDGWALYSRKDNYNEYRGKKISMLRAMKIAKIPRNIRRFIWKDYFDKGNKKE